MKRYTVSEAARIGKTSVRALHHYDAVGLLVPSARSEAGYRLYSTADLERLQQIRIYRELDFSLEAIAELLADPAYDRAAALRTQRKLLVEQQARNARLVRAIDAALSALQGERDMDVEELFAGFEAEARDRWGDTPEFAESQRRHKSYGRRDLERAKAEMAAIEEELATLLRAGVPATSDEAKALAEKHRLHVDRWWYPCPRPLHRRLAALYVADARFAAHYDTREKGLAQFLADAIVANAGD
jgi:MerR family transcriptional regulator, thiopeptide resistance regulator